MTDFRFSAGDEIELWGTAYTVVRIIDSPDRRAYALTEDIADTEAPIALVARATVDGLAEPLRTANKAY